MTAAAVRHMHGTGPSRLFVYASFAIMVGGWAAFLVALIASPQALDQVWNAVGDLPLVLEGLAWLFGFPFLVGLAFWNASWDEAVRLVAIAVLAVSYTYMFRPRQSQRRGAPDAEPSPTPPRVAR
jgi:hypothetical protein